MTIEFKKEIDKHADMLSECMRATGRCRSRDALHAALRDVEPRLKKVEQFVERAGLADNVDREVRNFADQVAIYRRQLTEDRRRVGVVVQES